MMEVRPWSLLVFAAARGVASRSAVAMAPAPPALRCFWPRPTLPRLPGGGGYLSEDDAPTRELLVGWWRASRGVVDAVVAGAVPSTTSSELDDILLAVIASAAESPRGLGPPRVIGAIVDPSEDASRTRAGRPRRATRRGARARDPHPRDDAPLWIEAVEASTSSSHLPVVRVARWRGADLLPPNPPDPDLDLEPAAVHLLLYPTPNPPHLRLVAPPGSSRGASSSDEDDEDDDVEDAADEDSLFPRAAPSLAWAARAMDRAGRLARPDASTPRRSSPTWLAVRAAAAATTALRALDAECIPGLRNRHAWSWSPPATKPKPKPTPKTGTPSPDDGSDVGSNPGGGFRWRCLCDVFASARVVRSRLRRIADGGDGEGPRSSSRRSSVRAAAWAGRAGQTAIDLALGNLVARWLLTHRADIVRAAMGGWRFGSTPARAGYAFAPAPSPLFGDEVRANAAWIMEGSPLGVKLHRPLARALGGAALTLVDELGRVVRRPSTARAMGRVVDAVAVAGSLGGFSLQAALAADVTTFLTTHVAALHVYSSLLVTAQIAAAGALYRLVAFGAAAPYAAPFASRVLKDGFESEARTTTTTSPSRLSRLEATVFGILALAPVALLLPTTAAFYLSYLAMHAGTVAARAAMVAASAATQHFPASALVARFAFPNAFPAGIDVAPHREREGHGDEEEGDEEGEEMVTTPAMVGVRYWRVEARVATWSSLASPFATAAKAWTAETAAAVAGACAAFGRLPVALVPFEPEEPECAAHL